ncbi:recombinase family protein [Salmonella enterica]|nr:recombinase family protein [Salmonella enterica]EAO0118483.1 recombinase family protein [Salmonella enterica]EAO3601703.1 recombinase family protein [Salmonella enterica]EAR6391600.1 recombinase family protein [Salmonella enterica]EAV1285245.1 recombinase family protein [Salmonella enterica]
MSRTFAYCRVSTREQTEENQKLALINAGYDLPDHRIICEQISGTAHAMQRPAFSNLVNSKLEPGDKLVVLKLDRLGRDNIDVLQTIAMLTERGIGVISLDLSTIDLTTSEGKLILGIMSAYAEFERNRLIDRTQDGLARARAEGKHLGRPVAVDTTKAVQKLKAEGMSQSQTAKELGVSVRTVKRHWAAA